MANEQTFKKFFQEKVARQDFARDFLLRLTEVRIVNADLTMGPNDLVYARSASLPGRSIQMHEAPYMGLPLRVPGAVQYEGSDGYEVEFYLPMDLDLHRRMVRATREIYNEDISSGNYLTPGIDSIITLAVLDSRLETVDEFNLVGASLASVGSVEYQMAEGVGAVQNFSATFTYHYHEYQR